MNSSPSIFVYRVMKLDEWSVFKKNKEFFGNSFDKNRVLFISQQKNN